MVTVECVRQVHWSADIDVAWQPAMDQRQVVLQLGRPTGTFDRWYFGWRSRGHDA
jgi:hypothetical protein